jgi:hypothetical protein
MWYRGYFIYYHQDIWGGVYAIYKKSDVGCPFHCSIAQLYGKDACIRYIDKLLGL